MPRESASALELVGTMQGATRLPAPAHLSEDQRQIWDDITAAYPAGHFNGDCAPLLAELVVHVSLARELAVALRETRTWDLINGRSAARRRETFTSLLAEARAESAIISSLSVKLRLTPSSHRRAPGHVDERKLTVLPSGRPPWERQPS
jgi:hypothetical protein